MLVSDAVSPPKSKEESLSLLDAFLQRVYPRNFAAVGNAPPWSCDQLERAETMNWRTRNNLRLLNTFLQVVSNNNPEHCTFLLKSFINSNTMFRELMKENENEKYEVVKSIKSFVTKLSDGGCKEKNTRRHLLWCWQHLISYKKIQTWIKFAMPLEFPRIFLCKQKSSSK